LPFSGERPSAADRPLQRLVGRQDAVERSLFHQTKPITHRQLKSNLLVFGQGTAMSDRIAK